MAPMAFQSLFLKRNWASVSFGTTDCYTLTFLMASRRPLDGHFKGEK
jgi:hypothetical protein